MNQASTVIFEDSSVVILARVKLVGTNAYLTQATTTSVSISTYNRTTATLTATTTPNKTDVIFDTLQVNSDWRLDETGYNIRIPLSAAHFPDGAENYQSEVVITPTDGFVIRFAVHFRTATLFSV